MSTPMSQDRVDGLLKNRAYETLRERIVSGELLPGDRISERSLGLELKMSKTPVKAALERLEEQGLVVLSPQRSAVVRAMTRKEIADHYEVRLAIEMFVARRAVSLRHDISLASVEKNLELQDKILSGPFPFEGWAAADYGFHLALAELCGNYEIIKMIGLLRDRLFQVVGHIARTDSSVPRRSFAEHMAIFEAVRDGREDVAAAAVTTHLENGRQFVLFGGVYGDPGRSSVATEVFGHLR